MTIYEQADLACGCRRDDCTKKFRFCWMLDRSYATRSEMIRWGWKWIGGGRGCRGTFATNDPAAVEIARRVLRLDAPKSNGSHAALGAPMHDVYAAREALEREYRTAGLDAATEIDGFATMTAEELRDEMTYLSDYQG